MIGAVACRRLGALCFAAALADLAVLESRLTHARLPADSGISRARASTGTRAAGAVVTDAPVPSARQPATATGPVPVAPAAAAPSAISNAPVRVVALFESGLALTNDRDELLDLARLLEATPDLDVALEGHTDSRGSPDVNRRLASERARWARGVLLEQGVDPRRVTVSAPNVAGDGDHTAGRGSRCVVASVSPRR